MEFLARGMPVELSKTGQKLLRLLIQNREQTLTRDMMIDAIWTDGAEYAERVLWIELEKIDRYQIVKESSGLRR